MTPIRTRLSQCLQVALMVSLPTQSLGAAYTHADDQIKATDPAVAAAAAQAEAKVKQACGEKSLLITYQECRAFVLAANETNKVAEPAKPLNFGEFVLLGVLLVAVIASGAGRVRASMLRLNPPVPEAAVDGDKVKILNPNIAVDPSLKVQAVAASATI